MSEFYNLHTTFILASILYHVNFYEAFFMKRNASSFVLGIVLLQIEENEKLYLTAFYYKNF